MGMSEVKLWLIHLTISYVWHWDVYIRIRNWPLPIGAFQDQCKLIVINEHNLGKNPNWQEADQLAIYKRRRKVELGATENNIS